MPASPGGELLAAPGFAFLAFPKIVLVLVLVVVLESASLAS
jgi:hypothetical protein